MQRPEMTDAEARQQVERTDAFIAEFRQLVAATAVDPASPCAAEARGGLERIAATVDAVDYVFYANLSNLNAAMRGAPGLTYPLLCPGAALALATAPEPWRAPPGSSRASSGLPSARACADPRTGDNAPS